MFCNAEPRHSVWLAPLAHSLPLVALLETALIAIRIISSVASRPAYIMAVTIVSDRQLSLFRDQVRLGCKQEVQCLFRNLRQPT